MLQISQALRLSLFILLLLIVSCSKYEKILKSDDYQLKYDFAVEYYENGDYVRATTLIEQILPVYRGTDKATELSYLLADCYFHRKDYIMSSHYFDNFVRDFPNNKYTEEAAFMRAYSNYLLSPRPSLDQTPTRRAIDQLTLFITRYPDNERAGEAKELIAEMRSKLLEKSFQSARLYYDMGDYRAAIIAFKNSIADFPETRHREELLFLILKSSYLLADNSVPERQLERFQAAMDEYYLFIEEFPESKYTGEAEQFFNNSMRVLDSYPADDLTNGL